MRLLPLQRLCFAALSVTLAAGVVHAADSSPLATAEVAGSGIQYSEVSRKTVNLGDHKMTFVRVRPPILSAPPPPPPVREPTAEEIAMEQRRAEKAYVTLSLTATVYLDGDRALTEIRWRNPETGNLEYRAWSNADFRYLTQVIDLESETTVYSWFPFVDVCDMASLPPEDRPRIPTNLSLSKTQAEYQVDAKTARSADQGETLAGLDYVHAYYQLHHAELKAYYDQLMAKNAAREKELRDNPPAKADTVLRFWPIKTDGSAR